MSDVEMSSDVKMRSTGSSYALGSAIEWLILTMNTFYSYKDIFIQELISNASNALDKFRVERLADKRKFDAEEELSIRFVLDKVNKTLSIVDNGIGMTGSDLVVNFTLMGEMRSRTREFMHALERGADGSMIREFGVGFYSAFLVAEKVIVTSKHDDDDQSTVEIKNGPVYVNRDVKGEQLYRGTKITLFLKEDQLEYLEERRIKYLVEKHAQFTSYPIYLWPEKDSFQLIYRQRPIWLRKPEEITKEEYAFFYKSLTNPWEEDYLAFKHFSVEGQLKFKAILFVPKRARLNFSCNEGKNMSENIKLYNGQLLSMDNCELLIPRYLGFVQGVVEIDINLQLHVSPEILQQHRPLMVIREILVKKCIEMFNEIAENEEDYNQFYEVFSNKLKLGMHEDSENRAKLADLLRYYSTKSGDKMTSLKDYVSRMQEGQEHIYYIAGEGNQALENSPFLSEFKQKGYEVLYMVGGRNQYARRCKYDGKKFVSVAKKGRIAVVSAERKRMEKKMKSLENLCKVMKDILGAKVDEVVVTGEYGWTCGNIDMESGGFQLIGYPWDSIKNVMLLRKNVMSYYMSCKKTMEINPYSSIIDELRKRAEADKNEDTFKDLVRILFQSALHTAVFSLSDPKTPAARIRFSCPIITVSSDSIDFEYEIDECRGGWQYARRYSRFGGRGY